MVGEAFLRVRPDTSGFGREVNQRVTRDVQGLERSLRSSNRELGRFTRGSLVGTGALRQLGRAAAFASLSFVGGAGLVVALKQASAAASSFVEQTSRSEVVFGRAARAVQSWAATAVGATGLAADEALRFSSEFGTILRGLEFTESAAADTSRELVQLGADLASISDTPIPEALAAIRSGLVGEIEPLRRYGVLLSEAATAQEALATTGKTSVQALTQQERAAARLRLIFRQTTLQQGDFARTSDSLANQQRILGSNIRNLQILLGETLNPEILRVVAGLNEWLDDTRNQERVQREFTSAVRDGVAIVEGFARALDTIRRIVSPAVAAVGGLTNAIELLVIAMAVSRVARYAQALGLIAPAARTAAVGVTAAETAVAAAGTSAALATTRVAALRSALFKLGAIGAITVGVTMLLGQSDGDARPDPESFLNDPEAQERFRRTFGSAELIRVRRELERALAERAALRALDPIEEIRAGRDPFGFRLPLGGDFIRGAVPGRPLSTGERLRLALAAAGLTPGTADDVAALSAQREQYQRQLAFAQRQLALGKGDTAQFAEHAERLSNEIRGINDDLARIAEDSSRKAIEARERAIAAMIPDATRGRFQGDPAALQAFVAGQIPRRIGGAAETDTLARIGGPAEIARLRTLIAEQTAAGEEAVVPFLQAERQALARQLRQLRLIGASKVEILNARLQQAQIDRRLRDIREGPSGFSLTDLARFAGDESARLGSNIGSDGLSGQDAIGSLKGNILDALNAGVSRSGNNVTVVQNFFGDGKNPGEAIQQASQAARALR